MKRLKQKRDRGEYQNLYKKEGRRKARALITSLKEGKPCLDCRETYPPVCMDFDHVRGIKIIEVSDLAKRANGPKTLKMILTEVRKCELVCANCHRIRTHLRRLAKAKSH